MWSLWLMLVCLSLIVIMLIWSLQAVVRPLQCEGSVVLKKPVFSRLFVMLLILVWCLALGLYVLLGSSWEWSRWSHFRTLQAQGEFNPATLSRWQTVLQSRTQTHPNDVKAWLILGKLQLAQHHSDKAAKALNQALRLAPNNIDIQLLWVEAQFYAHDQRLTGEVLKMAQELERKGLDRGVILTLLAVDADHKQQYMQAIQYWRKLLSRVAPGSDSYAQIQQAIAKGRGALNRAEHS